MTAIIKLPPTRLAVSRFSLRSKTTRGAWGAYLAGRVPSGEHVREASPCVRVARPPRPRAAAASTLADNAAAAATPVHVCR